MTNPYVHHPGDGSTLIEWVVEGVRFGINLEPGGNHSWYLVSNAAHGSLAELGYLPEWLRVEVDEEARPVQVGETSESADERVSPQPWEPPVTTVTVTDVGSDKPPLWREMEG